MADDREQIKKRINLKNKAGKLAAQYFTNNALGDLFEKTGNTKEAKNYREVSQEVEEWHMALFHDLTSGKLKVPITYEDPDQSPLKGDREGQILKQKWATGMDNLPQAPFCRHLSQWLLDIHLGNYSKFMMTISKMSKDELEQKLKMRETLYQIGAIFHVIIGARSLYTGSPLIIGTMAVRGKFEGNHMPIFEKLLELGVDVNVHDLAGYTPLHHCLTSQLNDTTLEMAKLLLAHGADPNAVNRFGNTPLFECVISDKQEAVKLLLRNGADPRIADNDGVSPFELSNKCLPKMATLFARKDSKDIAFERQRNAEQNPDLCSLCKTPSTKRCSGCRQELYCSVDCQRKGWKTHKVICKERRNNYLPVEIFQKPSPSMFNLRAGKVVMHGREQPKDSHFIIKIQVPLDEDGTALYVYDKTRSFGGYILVSTDSGAKLKEIVKAKGFKGVKGYFNAIYENGRLSISPDILMHEIW